jgi:predicted GIY-YIG superfamily endonuclease
MKGKFKEIVSKFPGWLYMLQKSPSLSRDQLRNVPDRGIYVFYDEKDQPLYVGRSDRMRKRLLAHSRPSSGHESATFAFILAKEQLINPEIGTKSRKALQSEEEFLKKYLETKIDVSKMRVRVIEIIEPTEQALFEIYAALELNTPYNVWENH